MLRLGSQVSGSTFGQEWQGTITSYVLEHSTKELKGLARLEKAIVDPAGGKVTDLVVPLNYLSPRMITHLGQKLPLHQYTVRWTDHRRMPTQIQAHWGVQYRERVDFFLWGRADPLASVSRDIRQVRAIERHRAPSLRLAPMVHPVKSRLRTSGVPDCPVCGVWSCTSCWEYRRPEARRSVDFPMVCRRCGSTEGQFFATRHLKPEKHLATL